MAVFIRLGSSRSSFQFCRRVPSLVRSSLVRWLTGLVAAPPSSLAAVSSLSVSFSKSPLPQLVCSLPVA